MKPDDRTRRIEPEENRDENIHAEHEVETEAAEVHEPQPNGWVAQLRQIMQRSPQGAARTNIKRQQLKEDRTKSFLLLAGLTVVLSLAFFAMFSTPNSRKNIARADHPNLGRARGAENPDTSHSVTPLLSADTRRPDDNAGSLSPDDIRNTAKQRMLAQASPSFGTPPEPPPEAPRPEPKDYALNRIQFPAETPEQTPPPPVPSIRETHEGVAGVRQCDVGDARIRSRSEQCPTSSGRTELGVYGASRRHSTCGPVTDASEFRGQDSCRGGHRIQL